MSEFPTDPLNNSPPTPGQSAAPPKAVFSFINPRFPLILPHPRSGRIYWAVLAFLIAFGILLIGVVSYYLLPAMDAAHDATVKEKRTLMAVSRLMLAVVLFVLFAGLLLTFRIGRFFFPRKTPPRTHTEYVDAWAEAGKRMQPPDD